MIIKISRPKGVDLLAMLQVIEAKQLSSSWWVSGGLVIAQSRDVHHFDEDVVYIVVGEISHKILDDNKN